MDDHFLYYNHNKIATIKSYTARNTSRRCWLVEYCICSLSQKQTFPFGCYIHAQFLNWFSRESRAPAEIMTTRSAVEQCGSLFCLFEGKPNVPSVHCFRSCSNEWEYHWPTNVAMHQQGGERQTLRQFKIYKKKGEMLSRQMCFGEKNCFVFTRKQKKSASLLCICILGTVYITITIFHCI